MKSVNLPPLSDKALQELRDGADSESLRSDMQKAADARRERNRLAPANIAAYLAFLTSFSELTSGGPAKRSPMKESFMVL